MKQEIDLQVTRRDVNKALAMSFFPFVKRVDLPSREEQAEKRLGIELITYKQLLEEEGKEFEAADYPGYKPEWDGGLVTAVTMCYDVLPAHFRLGNNMGSVLSISISPSSVTGVATFDRPKNLIELGHSEFTATGLEVDLHIVTHEGAHIMQPVGENPNTSFWYDEVEQIIGKPFHAFAQEMRPIVNDLVAIHFDGNGSVLDRPIGPSASEEDQIGAFYKRVAYGVSDNIPDEFIPIMAEYFLYGQKYFAEHFSRLLTTEQTSGLYNFVKENLFRGSEYPNFPVRNM